jgi:hypothetical protein
MPIVKSSEVLLRIREILKNGSVEYTLHCRERMYLRGVQMDDILFLLNWGKVEPGPEADDSEGQVFRVIGTDVEEEPLTAVVKIITDDRLLCITVFGE